MKTYPHGQKIARLLVVEDNRGVRELLAHTLEQSGYSVVTAADGEHALELLVSNPDLVVLDLMLPGMDGFEVCRRIRLESQVPIIMLTALGNEDDVMRGFGLGIDDYVTKPFSRRLLVARVAGLLRRAAER